MKKIGIRALIVSLILVLTLTLSTGCGWLTGAAISPSPSPPATENITPTENTPTIEALESVPPAESETSLDTGVSIPVAESRSPILPSIADVVAKVTPSVVAINTEVVSYDFFNRPFTQEGAGSGWVIKEDGYIVTNNHVIQDAKSITVTLGDNRSFSAVVKGRDQLADLAVLKIGAKDLPALKVGDSATMRVGDWVVAIGNALGKGISATHGIVSRKDVSIDVDLGQTLYGLIQTNAAINPGNSGGPLVNLAGEVVGITSAKLAEVSVEGVGYAISTSEAIPIIEQLLAKGYVVRPWLGVSLYTVNPFVILQYNLTVQKGALVTEVAPGSPADKAGLRAGDVITKFDKQEITDVTTLLKAIRSSQAGQTVEITFWRGDTKNIGYVTLAESPPPS